MYFVLTQLQLYIVLENVGVTIPSTLALINGGVQIWCLVIAIGEYTQSWAKLLLILDFQPQRCSWTKSAVGPSFS
jgi:hypothetical protein